MNKVIKNKNLTVSKKLNSKGINFPRCEAIRKVINVRCAYKASNISKTLCGTHENMYRRADLCWAIKSNGAKCTYKKKIGNYCNFHKKLCLQESKRCGYLKKNGKLCVYKTKIKNRCRLHYNIEKLWALKKLWKQKLILRWDGWKVPSLSINSFLGFFFIQNVKRGGVLKIGKSKSIIYSLKFYNSNFLKIGTFLKVYNCLVKNLVKWDARIASLSGKKLFFLFSKNNMSLKKKRYWSKILKNNSFKTQTITLNLKNLEDLEWVFVLKRLLLCEVKRYGRNNEAYLIKQIRNDNTVVIRGEDAQYWFIPMDSFLIMALHSSAIKVLIKNTKSKESKRFKPFPMSRPWLVGSTKKVEKTCNIQIKLKRKSFLTFLENHGKIYKMII